MTNSLRPPTIDCPDWAPDPADARARRCTHYAGPSGRCLLERNGLPVRLMCVEWLKLKGHVTTSAKLTNEAAALTDPNALIHCRRNSSTTGACGGTRETCTCECNVCAPPDLRSAPTLPVETSEQARVRVAKLLETGVTIAGGPDAIIARTLIDEAIAKAVTPTKLEHSDDAFLASLTDSPPPPVLSLLAPPPPKDAPAPRPPPEDPSAPLRLVPAPAKPRKAADIAREALALGFGRSTTVTIADPPPFDPAKAIDPADIAALEAAHPEVTLYSEELGGSVTLVTAPTSHDRLEITFRDAATLRLLVDTFPGARVIALARKK